MTQQPGNRAANLDTSLPPPLTPLNSTAPNDEHFQLTLRPNYLSPSTHVNTPGGSSTTTTAYSSASGDSSVVTKQPARWLLAETPDVVPTPAEASAGVQVLHVIPNLNYEGTARGVGGMLEHRDRSDGGNKMPPKYYLMENEWESGLCSGCCDSPSLSLGVLCCPLCCLCKASNDLNESLFVPLCLPLPLLSLRSKTRHIYRIKGSLCDDCLAVVCCHPCAQLQVQLQLTKYLNPAQTSRIC
ncbi:PLAC8-like protein 1 [Convolutriloba macropyga]|uniref:PLAC8-like protein 1 n=1 Tax=Convolutriloba macropyga TaxID=536237 RepID=UPI003F51F069